MNGPEIAGFGKLTLLDYPGRVAAEIFTQGCNMRCPFCHNYELTSRDNPLVGPDEVLDYLAKRKAVLDGLVVSGGEPTMQDLRPFLERVKSMGYAVKLDTNGTRPDVLSAWIEDGLVDYVAMDVKNSEARYPETCGLPRISMAAVKDSIRIIKASGLAYQFRTTVTPSLHTPANIRDLCENLVGDAMEYWLQPFAMRDTVPAKTFLIPDGAFMDECLAAAREYTPNAAIRGTDGLPSRHA